MDSIQFLYWLQGYFELTVAYDPDGGYKAYPVISMGRIKCIREHIKLVKEFESMGFQSNKEPIATPKTDNIFINWLEGFLDCLEGECIRIHDLNENTDEGFRVLELDRYKATRIIGERLAAQFNKVTPDPLVHWEQIIKDNSKRPVPIRFPRPDETCGGPVLPSHNTVYCGGAGD